MTIAEAKQLQVNDRIQYNDGREGHTDALATVLDAYAGYVRVQFDDRADTTVILFRDAAWLRFISRVSARHVA